MIIHITHASPICIGELKSQYDGQEHDTGLENVHIDNICNGNGRWNKVVMLGHSMNHFMARGGGQEMFNMTGGTLFTDSSWSTDGTNQMEIFLHLPLEKHINMCHFGDIKVRDLTYLSFCYKSESKHHNRTSTE
jgi:hypothetical protein